MRYVCQTLFDITPTGVTGHCKSTRWPYTDRAGQKINDEESWNRSRNQQRNWETLQQILGLRTQITYITQPITDQTKTRWMFEFETETTAPFGTDADPVEVLRADADGVPMLRELRNDPDIETCLITHGPRQNIWFAVLPINT